MEKHQAKGTNAAREPYLSLYGKERLYSNPPLEIIHGQVVGKANNYMTVPGAAPGQRRIIKNEKIRAYEAAFTRQCTQYRGAKIDTPFTLEVTLYFKSWIYDLDNALKTILDCLQYVGAITDDNLCRRIVADKKIDRIDPRVEIRILAEAPPPSLFD